MSSFITALPLTAQAALLGARLRGSDDELATAFNMYDADSDGVLNVRELAGLVANFTYFDITESSPLVDLILDKFGTTSSSGVRGITLQGVQSLYNSNVLRGMCH